MFPPRKIAPAPPPRFPSDSNRSTLGQHDTTKNPRQGEKRKRHDDNKWEAVRDAIIQTYADHTLDDTIRIIKETCGFEASVRSYKQQLKAWGVEKNVPAKVLLFAIQKQQERLREGSKTAIFFNGVYIDEAAVKKFQMRQQYPSQAVATAPPTVTPNGVEYFTPFTPGNSLSEQLNTPQVFTPISKLSAFAAENYEILKTHPVAQSLLQRDVAPRKIRVIQAIHGDVSLERKHEGVDGREGIQQEPIDVVESLRLRRIQHKAITFDKLVGTTEHTHYLVHLSAAGSGRFERQKILQDLLWCSQVLAGDMFTWVCREETRVESNVTLTKPIYPLARRDEIPQFHLDAQTEAGADCAVESLLALLRHHKILQRILGLSQEELRNWIGPWERMSDDTAQVLHNTAECLLGNPVASHPHVHYLTVLVCFNSSMTSNMPLLLRIFIGTANRNGTPYCRVCDNNPMVLDYIGRHGALKLQAPAMSYHQTRPSIDDFLCHYRLESTVCFSKWSLTSYICQGLVFRRTMRPCYCNGAVHRGGFKPHYFDLQREQEARDEQWCPVPTAQTTEDFFQPYPPNNGWSQTWVNIVGYDGHELNVDQRWDPLGQYASNREAELFEHYPSDEESEQQYVSKPEFICFGPKWE